MKILINLLLVLAIAALGYLLYDSINEPIAFKSEYSKRKEAVAERLGKIRDSQELYRSITGTFAPTFDTLEYVLKNDSIPFQQVFSDPKDPDNEAKFIYKTVYTNALDSLSSLEIAIDSLRFVPYAAKGTEFSIQADTMTYQKTIVSVTEVATRYNVFMGKYGDAKYSMYDNRYDPTAPMKFGDMSSPNLGGNWE